MRHQVLAGERLVVFLYLHWEVFLGEEILDIQNFQVEHANIPNINMLCLCDQFLKRIFLDMADLNIEVLYLRSVRDSLIVSCWNGVEDQVETASVRC